MNPAIQTHALSRRFRRHWAVRDLSLQVDRGAFYALVGPSGAGKTTTLSMLLGLLSPSTGEGEVLGRSVHQLGPADRARIGYLPEQSDLPEWMRLTQFLDYLRPLYPGWDDALCARLIEHMELPMEQKLRTFSRGMRQKASLLTRLAYRPELLVMDEPFAGVDPLTRDQLVEGLLTLGSDSELTVFVCSHDLDEIERLIDHVGFLSNGSLLLSEELAALQQRFRELEVTLDQPVNGAAAQRPEHWLSLETAGRTVRIVHSQYPGDESSQKEVRARFPGARQIQANPMSLRSVFIALSRGGGPQSTQEPSHE